MKPIGQLIKARLMERGMTVSHLARLLSCERANLYRLFEKDSIDTRLLLRISRALDYDFFQLYSNELQK
ncbi:MULTISPECIES: helix-turn-helix domain-containing protein [unclassified Bacteroides]|jgi:plasmid maintenance system antidote protein VapI|uniref:helix-turn-helix domain-containing protein n=1 Tax=unclassified Bacteroides TaxID=2646097 RepID=UPI000E9495F5|nr:MULTISPECIES: helix-turn-helix domain-containing protein [unclassified Bacteroides]RGN47614.1 XRE family transcriptional regulator [Bacteroides sp. OM05-12]RHR75366.1 XRE family transcriptional regulator [Bacteroides sp. AF16-49]